MNMQFYIEFRKAFEWLVKNHDTSLSMDDLKEKSEFYSRAGILSEEEQKKYWQYRTHISMNYVRAGLEQAKFFEVDDVEKRLMLLTDSPKSSKILRLVRLPFPAVFLDVDIKASEMPAEFKEFGFENIIGMMLMRINATDDSAPLQRNIIDYSFTRYAEDAEQYIFCAFAYRGENNIIGIYDLTLPISEGATEHIVHERRNSKITKFFRNFVINFSLFITHPEVETIYFERTAKSQERRIKEGKMPLPSSHRIRLTGKIKQYVYNNRASLGDGFDFKFWVRGHWRVHHSERYKNMQGKIIWIEPFLKGSGELRQSTYAVVADDEHKQEYSDKFKLSEDFEGSDKPLDDIKNEGV